MVNPPGTIEAAVARLKQPPESTSQEPTQEEVTDEVVETEIEGEADSEDEVAPHGESRDQDEGSEGEALEADNDTEPELYTVKINGEEKQVTLDDLRSGYMMESDYRKKTSEVAKQRETVAAKLEQLDQRMREAEAVVQFQVEDLASNEMADLKQYDPQAYYEKKEKAEEAVKKLQKLKDQRDKERSEALIEETQRQTGLLFEALPEWLDQDKAKADMQSISKLWQNLGFTQAELQNFTDHRLVLISRKAALYDEMLKGNVRDKKVTPKPKSAKPGVKKTPESVRRKTLDEAKLKARKTGRMDDAQAAIKRILGE